MRVSRICLGMMSFGNDSDREWALDEDAAEPIVRAAVEGGITFFDTADTYSGGASEVATGRLVRKMLTRDEVVIATKVFMPMTPGENGGGLSRKHVLSAIDASLGRLGMDYVDLYQIHRWDPRTPIEETMGALHDIVRAGKARYIGASSMFAWQFAKAQHVAERNGWTRFVSMQPHYNLLYREEEREMIPLCIDQGHRGHPLEPAGPRGPHRQSQPRRGASYDTVGIRPLHGLPLQPAVGLRRRRTCRQGGFRATGSTGPGGPGVVAAAPRRDRAHRGIDQARSPHRRPGGREVDAECRGGQSPRGALRPAPGPGALLIVATWRRSGPPVEIRPGCAAQGHAPRRRPVSARAPGTSRSTW